MPAVNCFPETVLNTGRSKFDKINANIKAVTVSSTDSVKNCEITFPLTAPRTFLIPISTERLEDLAVERFI